MTDNEKAVIIGCYLNGAKPELIAAQLMYPLVIVCKVIEDYKKKKDAEK